MNRRLREPFTKLVLSQTLSATLFVAQQPFNGCGAFYQWLLQSYHIKYVEDVNFG